MKNKQSIKSKIYDFFENPKGFWAVLVQGIIAIGIILSVGIVVVEIFFHKIYLQYEFILHIINLIILGVFTIEFILRLFSSPSKLGFIRKPLNVIDFFAIAPNYFELILPFFIETTEFRVIRLIRMLRFTRTLRLLKFLRYGSLFKKIFHYKGTILQSITPVLILFIGLKSVTWILESFHLWIANADLGELFAIIGFALGIILSQKIGVSYDKFIQIEEAIIRIYGNLRTLTVILNNIKPAFKSDVVKKWVQKFLLLLENPEANNFEIYSANTSLYRLIYKTEKEPADLAMLCGEIIKDSSFCLSKKERITPKAYDTLLHQATMLYLTLITVFIPGITGLISVIVATYILYGMYELTQDLDSILGGKFSLININISELKYLIDN